MYVPGLLIAITALLSAFSIYEIACVTYLKLLIIFTIAGSR